MIDLPNFCPECAHEWELESKPEEHEDIKTIRNPNGIVLTMVIL